MSRLILVPQFPTKLRYQEWWYTELPAQYLNYFDDVVVLGKEEADPCLASAGTFSPTRQSVLLETKQVQEYVDFPLRRTDALLLCDLSFPGIFSQVLFHKRPDRCAAICHATSKNRYDYFAKDRAAKWRVESGVMRLFDVVFVATFYHALKLGIRGGNSNVEVVGLPLPPVNSWNVEPHGKCRGIVSVSRDTIQKRNKGLERYVEETMHVKIERPCMGMSTWEAYYTFLSESKVMLITSKEETFGYQVLDAIYNNCIPVAPYAFSYPELLPSEYLYKDRNELIEILTKALGGDLPVPQLRSPLKESCESFYRVTAGRMQGWLK